MARRRVHLAFSLALLAAAPRLARADAFQDLVSAAYEAAKAGRWEEVPEYVKRADKIAPDADSPIPPHTLARLWYLEGVSYWFGGQKEAALNPWRSAFQAQIDYQWESESFADEDGEALFESLRRETRSRPEVTIGIPSSTGATRFFVDGQPADASTRRAEGRYLVQAVCPDGSVQGKWWKYGKPPKYESFCPSGFGAVATATPAATGGEVLFDDFGNPIVAASAVRPSGPAPTASADAKAPAAPGKPAEAAKTPAATSKPPATPPKGTPAPEPPKKDTPKATAATPPPPKAPAAPKADGASGGLAGPLLLGGGGALLAGGAVVNFLLVNPTWSDLEAARAKPATVTRGEADDLTARFNTWRAVTLGLLGAGAASATVGILLHDARIVVLPGGFVAEGRF